MYYNLNISNLMKAVEHVQRLAGILHILKIVSRKLFNLINQIGVFASLDDTFKNLVLADTLVDADLMIDYETCFNAKKMVDYYLSVKKILAGYDPNSNKILTGKNGKIYLNKSSRDFSDVLYILLITRNLDFQTNLHKKIISIEILIEPFFETSEITKAIVRV